MHQLRQLANAGAEKVVLCVGYLGHRIEDAIGHEQFGVSIAYSDDGPELAGTLGAIRRAQPLLGDRFLTLYGDTYLRVDYRAFEQWWTSSSLPAAMTLLRNRGKWGTSNAVYADGIVTRYDKLQYSPGMEWIDYGLGGLTAEALAEVSKETRDLADLHQALAQRGLLGGFEVDQRFYEIGTPEALRETAAFLLEHGPGHSHEPADR